MSSNTDIIALLSSEADQAVDQIIEDSKRLHIVVNGDGTAQATTEDGSLIPSVRKALLDNLYFKTPPLPWRNGGSVTEYNQLYTFTDSNGLTAWWYAPSATTSNPAVMTDDPANNKKFKVFLDRTNMADIYAPIQSPNFRGNPRTPTPAAGDNSQTIPNTQWVQTELDVLRQQIGEIGSDSDFENINVRNKTTTKDLDVSGKITSTGSAIDALNALLRVRQIELPSSASYVNFTTTAPFPVGITRKTSLTPFEISTGTIRTDVANFNTLTAGDINNGGVSVDLKGNAAGDYLHLSGTTSDPVNDPKPQLIVDGIAEIGTLRVNNLEGFVANVDGQDIRPRSVTASEFVNSKNITATGTTTVKDLVITGTVTGLDVNVDGKDIRPNSVVTNNEVNVGTSLTVGVDATITRDMNVGGTTTVKNLVVTGTVTGIDLSVDGKDILPHSVGTTTLTVTGKTTGTTAEFDKVTSDLFNIPPKTIALTSSEFTPDGTSSLYDILVDRNVLVKPPVGLFTGGVGGTILMYFTQDTTGGRTVTFSPEFVKIGDGDFDTSASGTTIVQLLYRGKDQVIDTVITSRR